MVAKYALKPSSTRIRLTEVSSAQTHELKCNLISTIARALAVFCIDEIVIFSDGCEDLYAKPQSSSHAEQDAKSGYTAFSDPNQFAFHVLSYLECPPVLRPALFGFHPNLRTAGSLPSLDIPSHARKGEWSQYREGVTVDPPKQHRSKKSNKPDTYVNAGLPSPLRLDPRPPDPVPPHTRVTLKLSRDPPQSGNEEVTAEVIGPEAPREDAGYYWGFTPRLAGSLTEVFTECPYEGGYDYSIGTSERGSPLKDLTDKVLAPPSGDEGPVTPSTTWNHLLIVFGGPAGLEKAVQNDPTLAQKGIKDASELFDAWVNFVEGQGSRTIRTEEAVWMGLMGLWEFVKARNC